MSAVDREALALRNRAMAEAFHTPPLKHRIRHAALSILAQLPTLPAARHTTERILIIRPDHLGDVLLTTPAIRALRQARPRAEIHALVGGWAADVLANNPDVDQVLTLAFPGFTRTPKENWRTPYWFALRTARQLRMIGYSAALILRPDHWWGALVCKLAGIPRRIGYDLPDVGHFLNDRVPFVHQHAVRQNALLIERLTGSIKDPQLKLSFSVSAEDSAWVQGYLSEHGVSSDEKLLCIHPGSGTWVKRWGEDHWAQVADTLADQLDARVIFTGGDHELELVQEIRRRMKHDAISLAGDTRVGTLAALFQRAALVLGPDSGPLHLAAAVYTPTVTLFGPADPTEFGTWGDPEQHPILFSNMGCRPCRILDWGTDAPENHPCVRDIPVGRVLEAARRAYQAANPG
jgi:heptosyltransferase-2/heptosyltransferase-3